MDEGVADIGSHGLVITCEHAGNRIPESYRYLFYDYQTQLNSHRGFDAGALIMARALAKAFAAPLIISKISRLLVDLNRSIGHPSLYSQASLSLSAEERQKILQQYYQPYRSQVEHWVRQIIAGRGQVIHLSSHSFTPELDGQLRDADIGLLYDPSRLSEVVFCRRWKSTLRACAPDLKVRLNYPYVGKGDGLTSWLRRQLPPSSYVGIELEINQKQVIRAGRDWAALRKLIVESLRIALTDSITDISK